MLKLGERGLACGSGHEKFLGLGQTLTWDPEVEIGEAKSNSKSKLRIMSMVLELVLWVWSIQID